jgi:hypothetical protein
MHNLLGSWISAEHLFTAQLSCSAAQAYNTICSFCTPSQSAYPGTARQA